MRRAFSPPESEVDLRVRARPGEADHRCAASDFGYGLSAHALGDMVVDAAAGFELVDLMLGEIADLKTVRARHLARHGLEPSGDELGEGRLAVAVLA